MGHRKVQQPCQVEESETTNGWKQIDVQLKRSHDLIRNLVRTVIRYLELEQDTLEEVIQARNQAITAKAVADAAAKEDLPTGPLSQLFALVQNYPELKLNQNVPQLREELTSTENKISWRATVPRRLKRNHQPARIQHTPGSPCRIDWWTG